MKLLEIWAQGPLALSAGWALVHSLWQGAIAAALLAVALAVARSARVRYAGACLALGALLAGFCITFVVFLRAHAATPAPVRIALTATYPGRTGTIPLPSDAPNDIPGWFAPFWMAGVLVFYLRQISNWSAARRLRVRGVCRAPELWQQRIRILAARLRLRRPIELLESSLAQVPVVIGHLRPVILVPVGMLAGLPPGQVEAILLHELAHIRRFDYLVNLLQTAAEGLLFYHPLVWWISGVIRAEREHCCDDIAVESSGSAHEYSLALAALEQSRPRAPEPALAATGGSLVKRIRRILFPAERPGFAMRPLLAAGVLTFAATAGLLAWQNTNSQPTPTAQNDSPYTRWLNEDVVYIITAAERDAFLQLGTDDERNHFIEQFWLRRDPTPGAPRNEFKEEHYRRIAYTNQHFSDLKSTPGWKTDRGRIYIEFGPPDEMDVHPNGDGKTPYPFQLWRYRFIQGIGNDVFMEFVDKTGLGEYRMTSDPNPPTGNTR